MSMRMGVWLIGIAFFFAGYYPSPSELQKLPGLDTVRRKIDGFSVQKLVQGDPAITTSLSDAVTEVPFLDDFDPQYGIPLSVLPQDKNGRFLLIRPGLYAYTMQSYCLRAGNYGPGKGDGYLYAPLKGKQSQIVRSILQRSSAHREIPQGDIQVLIWAILSKTKINAMSASYQRTAAALLTSSEIYDLNGGALGLVPQSVLGKALDGVSSELRPVLQAEATLRNLLSQGDVTYASLERAAVLTGEAPPGAGSRQVPWGRWSYHPAGYFTRYFPHSYSTTDIQIYVPERFKIGVDAQGRMCSIADTRQNRLEWEYDDRAGSAELAGDPALRAYAFRSIRYAGSNPASVGEQWQKSWEGVGWTFLAGSAGASGASRPANQFTGFDERRHWGGQHHAHLKTLASGVRSVGGRAEYEADPSARNEVLSLGHVAAALSQIIERGTGREAAASLEALYLVKRAWMAAVAGAGRKRAPGYDVAMAEFPRTDPRSIFVSMGAFRTSTVTTRAWLQRSTPTIEGPSSPEMFDPSANVATPGNTWRQRLGGSPRPSGGPPCAGIIVSMSGDVKINGQTIIPVGNPVIPDMNGAVIQTGAKGRIGILMQDGNIVRIGQKTQLNFDPICSGSGPPSPAGLITGAASSSLPSGRSFQLPDVGNIGGIRGDLRLPFRSNISRPLPVSLARPQESTLLTAEDRAEIGELALDEGDLAYARSAAVMVNHPPDFAYVKVIKGVVQLIDSNGSTRLMSAGDEFFRKWEESAGSAGTAKITVRGQP